MCGNQNPVGDALQIDVPVPEHVLAEARRRAEAGDDTVEDHLHDLYPVGVNYTGGRD